MTIRSVEYAHKGVKLEGYLAYDARKAAPGKLPGVLVVHEWWGLNDYTRTRADQLASLGYAAFALDMFGKGVVTTDAKKAAGLAGAFYGKPIMAERARAGLDQLLETGLVDAARVAAIGYCFGGTTVLTLAFSGAPLAAAVSFHGGLPPVPASAAGNTKAGFLICHGAVDTFVKKAEVDAFLGGMDKAKLDYQFNSYAGAIHAFTNPDADRLAEVNGLVGGIGYNAAADRRSWANMRTFLEDVFDRR